MGDFLKLLRAYLPTAVLLLLVLPVGAVSVAALVWRSEHEVLWHGSWVFRECLLPDGEGDAGCIGQYELSFGNTGDHSESVSINWQVDLRNWSMDSRVLNISAGRQRTNDPQFSCEKLEADTSCAISDFAAGTLLIVKLRCLACDPQNLFDLGQILPTVASAAKVYDSDPRATLLFRRVSVWLSWL